MNMRAKMGWILLVLGGVVLAGALLLWRGRPAAPLPEKVGAPLEIAVVDVATVRSGRVTRSVQLSGLMQPVRQSLLTAEVEGRVEEVMVRAGERVAAGQVLARMDTRDLGNRLAQQRANLAASRAQLELAQKNFDRNQELLARNFISATTVDNSRSTLEAARETLKANEALVALASQAQDKAVIRAPLAGVVAERSIEVGQHVGLNARLFSIVDLSKLEFAASVPVTQVAAISIGQEVTLAVEGMSGSVTGKVERISPVADQGSRMIPVFVGVANQDARLKGGMVAQGRIVIADSGATLLVSDQTIRHEQGADKALVVAAGKIEQRSLTLGLRDEENGLVEVRSGLKEGEQVLLARVAGLAPGQVVKLAKQ